MKTEIKINVRTYGVVIEDNRTGEVSFDTIVLDKQRVQAAQLLGMSDRNVIRHIYNRNGFNVRDIQFYHKTEISVDLGKLLADVQNPDCEQTEATNKENDTVEREEGAALEADAD